MTLTPLVSRVKKIVSHKIYSLAKIRNFINMNCAFTIYEQTILPLLDYFGFMQISANVSEKYDLQLLQNNALRICHNVRLRDGFSIERMHQRANLLSLEQRRQKQVLFLMFMYKERHENVRRVYPRNTRAAHVYSFVQERYHNVKYKNSSYYKGSLLWDTLPVDTRRCMNILDLKKSIKQIYSKYDDVQV